MCSSLLHFETAKPQISSTLIKEGMPRTEEAAEKFTRLKIKVIDMSAENQAA
jgi:hypothetical protein